jgi:hypothetical protein
MFRGEFGLPSNILVLAWKFFLYEIVILGGNTQKAQN